MQCILNEFNLLIDIRNRRLIDGIIKLGVKSDIMTVTHENRISTVNKPLQFYDLLKLFANITKSNVLNTAAAHEVNYYIETKRPPVYSKARSLNPEKLALAKREFQFMLDHNIIRP